MFLSSLSLSLYIYIMYTQMFIHFFLYLSLSLLFVASISQSLFFFSLSLSLSLSLFFFLSLRSFSFLFALLLYIFRYLSTSSSLYASLRSWSSLSWAEGIESRAFQATKKLQTSWRPLERCARSSSACQVLSGSVEPSNPRPPQNGTARKNQLNLSCNPVSKEVSQIFCEHCDE